MSRSRYIPRGAWIATPSGDGFRDRVVSRADLIAARDRMHVHDPYRDAFEYQDTIVMRTDTGETRLDYAHPDASLGARTDLDHYRHPRRKRIVTRSPGSMFQVMDSVRMNTGVGPIMSVISITGRIVRVRWTSKVGAQILTSTFDERSLTLVRRGQWTFQGT